MEVIVLGMLILILVVQVVLVLVLLTKKKQEETITEKVGKLETSILKDFLDFKGDLGKDFLSLNTNIENRLRLISDKVNERLDENFEKTNKTFASVLERLSKIDEAQKKIENLSSDIVSLESVLTDKKTRGIFGEVNLLNILDSVFGKNDKIYKMQYPLENGTIADCMLFAPEPLGMIAIDSKFPLEHYRIMVDKKRTSQEREQAEKLFKNDMKKHIDAIASKYIIKGVTSDQAILFLPAEAIFAEVSAYHSDVIEYAYKKRVWLTSPTTLISTLTTLQLMIKNMERDKYTSIIHQELLLLDEEFKRYKERWDKLSRSIDSVSKDVKDIHTTTDKITKRFNSINQVEIENTNHDYLKEETE
jgi:DNA recombination protein RmuC